jgi:beta-1,4-mannosyl-glycoprotein beta-1,4-N-acetylglucosaminyltransferase
LIHDCFTYAGEEDLLRLRLETLNAVVDRFVIAEATRTFTGLERQPMFRPEAFERWRDRIVYVRVDDLDPKPASAWLNEYHQRNALLRGLAAAQADDWVLLSDVDEIPAPEAIGRFEPRRFISAVLEQRAFCYALNNELVEADGATDVTWRMARITTAARVRQWFGSMQSMRIFKTTGPLRSVKRQWNRWRTQRIPNAGWHFSYLMTPEQIAHKILSFSHQEFNRGEFTDVDRIRERIRQRTDPFGQNRRYAIVAVDDSFPLPLRADPERYRQWLL